MEWIIVIGITKRYKKNALWIREQIKLKTFWQQSKKKKVDKGRIAILVVEVRVVMVVVVVVVVTVVTNINSSSNDGGEGGSSSKQL